MSRDGTNGHTTGRALVPASAGALGPHPQDADAIRAEIARARTDVLTAMDDLQDRWDEVTSWRGLVARRPLTCVLGAAGLGALLALLLRPRTGRQQID